MYLVLLEKDGKLELISEKEHIKDCNEYLIKDSRYKIIDCWQKP